MINQTDDWDRKKKTGRKKNLSKMKRLIVTTLIKILTQSGKLIEKNYSTKIGREEIGRDTLTKHWHEKCLAFQVRLWFP